MSVTLPPVLRRSERIHVQIPVDYAASTVDFSALGVRVRSSAGLVPGERVQCVLEEAGEAVPSLVVWAGPLTAQQTREIGIEFLMPFQTIV